MMMILLLSLKKARESAEQLAAFVQAKLANQGSQILGSFADMMNELTIQLDRTVATVWNYQELAPSWCDPGWCFDRVSACVEQCAAGGI